jgi:hypothetical protein
MTLFYTLERLKKTVSILTAPITALILLWYGKDESIITGATAGIIISIIDYVELFIKKN